MPQIFCFDNRLDIGDYKGEKVVEHYGESEGVFTETILTVTIDVAPNAPRHLELAIRSKYMKQLNGVNRGTG